MRFMIEMLPPYDNALRRMAEEEYRCLKEQAAWLIVQSLNEWIRRLATAPDGHPDVWLYGPDALPRSTREERSNGTVHDASTMPSPD